jgi:hypothetical protein
MMSDEVFVHQMLIRTSKAQIQTGSQSAWYNATLEFRCLVEKSKVTVAMPTGSLDSFNDEQTYLRQTGKVLCTTPLMIHNSVLFYCLISQWKYVTKITHLHCMQQIKTKHMFMTESCSNRIGSSNLVLEFELV